jgi:hypothetical protein
MTTAERAAPPGAQYRRRGDRSSEAGQATLETLLTMALVLLFIFGLLHLTMMMTTKFLVNYAAFAAARVAMVRGTGADEVTEAARQAMEIWQWWPGDSDANVPEVSYDAGREGMVVRYRVWFVSPIFTNVAHVSVEGFAPVAEQPDIPEEGDNAR